MFWPVVVRLVHETTLQIQLSGVFCWFLLFQAESKKNIVFFFSFLFSFFDVHIKWRGWTLGRALWSSW